MNKLKNISFNELGKNNDMVIIVEFYFPICSELFQILDMCSESVRMYNNTFGQKMICFRIITRY